MLEYIAPHARTRSMNRTATEKLGTHGRRCALKYRLSRVLRSREVLTCGFGPGGYRNALALAEVWRILSSLVHENGGFVCWTTSLWTYRQAAVLLYYICFKSLGKTCRRRVPASE